MYECMYVCEQAMPGRVNSVGKKGEGGVGRLYADDGFDYSDDGVDDGHEAGGDCRDHAVEL